MHETIPPLPPSATNRAQFHLTTWLIRLQQGLGNPAGAFGLLFLVMLGLSNLVTLQPNDDQFYAAIHLTRSLPEFLTSTYLGWSGRILSLTLFYYLTGDLFFLWKWLNAACVTVAALVTYILVTDGRDMSNSEKLMFAYLSSFSLFLISSLVLFSTFFWVTGSVVYVMPLALALVGFLPFFRLLQNPGYRPGRFAFLYALPAGAAALGGEQAALCFAGFSVLILSIQIVRRRSIPALLWVILAVFLVCEVVALKAPGNALRMVNETNIWFPRFNQIGLKDRLALYLHFMFNTIFSQWYLVACVLFLLTAVMLTHANATLTARITAGLLYAGAFLIGVRFTFTVDKNLARGVTTLYNNLFTFPFLNSTNITHPAVFLPYLIWGLGLLLIPLSILLIFKRSGYALFYNIIYLAALASLSVMAFSPTMYGSGYRTSFVSLVLLVLLILLLMRHDGRARYFAAAVLLIAAVQILLWAAFLGTDGYQMFSGGVNTTGIPFKVMQ